MRCRRSGHLRPIGDKLGKLWISLLAVLGLMVPSCVARADGGSSEAISLPAFHSGEMLLIWVVLASGIVSVLFGVYWYRSVASKSAGTEKMEEVGKAIRDGANAYLSQQVRAMAVLVVIVAIGLFCLYYNQASLGYGLKEALGVALFFVAGVGASYLAGYIGMGMAMPVDHGAASRLAIDLSVTAGDAPNRTSGRSGCLGQDHRGGDGRQSFHRADPALDHDDAAGPGALGNMAP